MELNQTKGRLSKDTKFINDLSKKYKLKQQSLKFGGVVFKRNYYYIVLFADLGIEMGENYIPDMSLKNYKTFNSKRAEEYKLIKEAINEMEEFFGKIENERNEKLKKKKEKQRKKESFLSKEEKRKMKQMQKKKEEIW